jgi:hypothetical protein
MQVPINQQWSSTAWGMSPKKYFLLFHSHLHFQENALKPWNKGGNRQELPPDKTSGAAP